MRKIGILLKVLPEVGASRLLNVLIDGVILVELVQIDLKLDMIGVFRDSSASAVVLVVASLIIVLIAILDVVGADEALLVVGLKDS